MAFLDNSGDILLDAVLTDTGRMRMARGDFKIVKFALGDDEINYGLFEANHTSGSAYQDLKILQTPIFEAFTNNTSVMKSKLMTIGRTNILYLPKLLLNTKASPMITGDSNNNNTFIVIANQKLATLTTKMGLEGGRERDGYMYGHSGDPGPRNSIIIDQGIVDANEDQDITAAIDPDLRETQFTLKIDHRLLRVSAPNLYGNKVNSIVINATDGGSSLESPIFIDDDQIAHYAFGASQPEFVQRLLKPNGEDSSEAANDLMHAGPLGNRFGFRLQASQAAKSSLSLYTKLGQTSSLTIKGKNDSVGTIASCDFIDTIARVTGVTTGYSIDIPIRVVRNTNPS